MPLTIVTMVLLAPTLGFAAGENPARSGDRLLAPADLEAFFDGVMATHFQTYHIPGAAVAVVKSGEILFAKGYGYADLKTRTPVDAAKTLFRIGSVSKLFTWTAVMQLVERGALEIDRDVNAYLDGADFHVPATYPEPITMAHLMNHTAGFEDRNVGLFSHDSGSVRPLGEVLAGTLPQRVRPPGEVTAYSNHGAALAGYIVERVSGMPWASYVEENILKPLRMDHTTPRQPLPPDLEGWLAVGYEYSPALARFEPRPFEYVPAAPAGALSATAVDMARFMISHLQASRLEDSRMRILRAETAREMHSTSLIQDPHLGGIAHGFLEQPYGRLRTIGHGGDTFLFHSELRLVPSHNVGIFVAYNSPDGAVARDQLVRAFLDRYFASYADWPMKPAEKGTGSGSEARPAAESGSGTATATSAATGAAGTPDATEATGAPGAKGATETTGTTQAQAGESQQVRDVAKYAGVYGSTRVPRTTVDRLIELLSVVIVRPVPADEAGTSADGPGPSLLVTLSPSRGAQRFEQVEPGLFQEVDGPGRIAFVTGVKGRPDRLLMGSAWMCEKMAWYKTPPFQIGIVAVCFLLFLSAAVGWPVAAVVSLRRERRRQPQPRPQPRPQSQPQPQSRPQVQTQTRTQTRPRPAGPGALSSRSPLRGERLARWLAGIVSWLFLVVVVVLLAVLQDPFEIAFGVSTGLRALLGLALVTALLAPAVAAAAVVAWRNRHFTLAGRVHFTLVAAASVVFALWLNYWNLLGFRF
ncbi:MAG: serine hydrolase domain-containing protein [Bacillota bacterium]|nr:serine hydrolase domain-containing protein [Bacillota bacterium]